MMVNEDGMVECEIDSDESSSDGDSGVRRIDAPPPPPEFASKASTPAPKPPTPPTEPLKPTPPTPSPPVDRDPYGINRHLQVVTFDLVSYCDL